MDAGCEKLKHGVFSVMHVVAGLAKWPLPNVRKRLIATFLPCTWRYGVSLCTSVSSFYILAEFGLVHWVSHLQKFFLPSALKLRLAGLTNLFHVFSLLIFQDGPQRKKRKSEVAEVDKQLDIVAIGTAVGSILLYSTVKGELQSKLVSNTHFILPDTKGFSQFMLFCLLLKIRWH